MKIGGFQKMTLLDYPGKIAATIFLEGCNLRCPFCHNSLLVTDTADNSLIPEAEVLDYLEKRKGLLDGVCITGGEPLLQAGIEEFISKIRDLGYLIKLDTNGSRPKLVSTLISKGLIDRVAMDIKNSPEKYAATCGIEGLDLSPFYESIKIIMQSGIDYEFRTTVVNELHTEDDIRKIAEMISGAHEYYLQNFVDSGALIGENLSAATPETLENMRKIAADFVGKVEIRGI